MPNAADLSLLALLPRGARHDAEVVAGSHHRRRAPSRSLCDLTTRSSPPTELCVDAVRCAQEAQTRAVAAGRDGSKPVSDLYAQQVCMRRAFRLLCASRQTRWLSCHHLVLFVRGQMNPRTTCRLARSWAAASLRTHCFQPAMAKGLAGPCPRLAARV